MTKRQTSIETKSKRGGWGGTITPAAQVRRQLQAGTKPRRYQRLSLLDAIERLCDRADRGQSLMRKYGLSENDIHVALVYRPGNGLIGSSTLPAPEQIGPYIEKFERMDHVDFLGLCWWQTPCDENGRVPMWIEEFNPGDKRSAIELLIFKNALAKLSVTTLQERMQNK